MKMGVKQAGRRGMSGLSLIELMIALILGLLVVGAAIGIFLTNKQTYRTTDGLGRIQENVRTAFELMSRDIREAGGNPCANSVPLVNVLNNPSNLWWTRLDTWGNGLRGYGATEAFADSAFGTQAARRVSGTQAIELISASNNVFTIQNHDLAGVRFLLNTDNHGFSAGDLALVCSPRQAAIFQVSNAVGRNIGHAATGGAPGNCTTGLGMPLNCAGNATFKYPQPSSVITRLSASRWFIANNASGRRSLYQTRLSSSGPVTEEIAEGVSDMQIEYLREGSVSYQSPAAFTGDWPDVKSVRISMTFDGEPNTGSGGAALRRTLVQVASLRNRNP